MERHHKWKSQELHGLHLLWGALMESLCNTTFSLTYYLKRLNTNVSVFWTASWIEAPINTKNFKYLICIYKYQAMKYKVDIQYYNNYLKYQATERCYESFWEGGRNKDLYPKTNSDSCQDDQLQKPSISQKDCWRSRLTRRAIYTWCSSPYEGIW